MRNGSATSHTNGASTNTKMATGHAMTSKMHQATKKIRIFTLTPQQKSFVW